MRALVFLLALLLLGMFRSGLDSASRHVPRRSVRAAKPVPRHRKTKALAGGRS